MNQEIDVSKNDHLIQAIKNFLSEKEISIDEFIQLLEDPIFQKLNMTDEEYKSYLKEMNEHLFVDKIRFYEEHPSITIIDVEKFTNQVADIVLKFNISEFNQLQLYRISKQLEKDMIEIKISNECFDKLVSLTDKINSTEFTTIDPIGYLEVTINSLYNHIFPPIEMTVDNRND